jgi:hypothetical protein
MCHLHWGAVIEKGDTEEVDALVVIEPAPASILPARRHPAPAVRTAVAAAGGIVVGALLTRLLGRLGRRSASRLARPGTRAGRRPRMVPRRGSERAMADIVASRSLLVDVHLLGAGERRR